MGSVKIFVSAFLLCEISKCTFTFRFAIWGLHFMAAEQMEVAVYKAADAVKANGGLVGPQSGQMRADIKKAVQCVYYSAEWTTRQSAVLTFYGQWKAIARAVALLDDAPEDLDRYIVQILRLNAALAIETAHLTPRRGLRLRILEAAFVRQGTSLPCHPRLHTPLREMLHSSAVAGDRDVAVAVVKTVLFWGLDVLCLEELETWLSALVRTVRLLKDDTDDRRMCEVLAVLQKACRCTTDTRAIVSVIVPFMCDLLVDERVAWCMRNPEMWPALVRVLHWVDDETTEKATVAVVAMVRRGGAPTWGEPWYWCVLEAAPLLRFMGTHAASAAPMDVCNMVCTVFVSAAWQEPTEAPHHSLTVVMDVVSRCLAFTATVVGAVCSTRFLESAARVLVGRNLFIGAPVRVNSHSWSLCLSQFAALVVAVGETHTLHDQLQDPTIARAVTTLVARQYCRGDCTPEVSRAAVQALVPLWCHDLAPVDAVHPIVVETLVMCMRWSVLRQRWCAAVFRGRAVATLRRQAHAQNQTSKRRCK
jgi:hypothetical protein